MTKTEEGPHNPRRASVRVAVSADISQFFREALDDAAQSEGIDPSFAARSYLVGLLADYARPGRLTDEAFGRPLTLLLLEAMNSAGPDRFHRLQSLGDAVLYISGFFRAHLRTRGVELDYVSALGARAYDRAGAMLRRGASSEEAGAPDVFAELAERFPTFAELLGTLGETFEATAAAHTHRGTLQLYERWARTGSNAIAEALTERGILPLKPSELLH